MDTFHFLEAEGQLELDVGGSIGIVSQLVVVVETVVLCAEAKSLMPLHTGFLPRGKPVKFGTGLYEELHFHLFKLAHTENELTGNNLVTEGLANLCDTEGQLHTAGLLHVHVVHKDTLCSLGTQINLACTVGSRTHFGREHQVELTHVCPVAGTADGAHDFLVKDNLTQFGQVTVVQCLCKTFVQRIALGSDFQHAGAGAAELFFVELVLEALGSLGHFLVNLLVIFCQLLFNEHVSAVTLLAVAVVNQGIVEGINVSACLPSGGMHEDSSINTHDILVQKHHALPPILLDVVLQLNTVLAVVIHCAQTVVNVTAGENKAIFLAM